MTKTEYKRLCAAMDKVAEDTSTMYVKHGKYGPWVGGFKHGILVAKMILENEFEKKGGKNG